MNRDPTTTSRPVSAFDQIQPIRQSISTGLAPAKLVHLTTTALKTSRIIVTMNGHTNGDSSSSGDLISGIAHVNLTVPEGTLDQAHAFYGDTLGMKSRPVPQLQRGTLAW